jgi:hypothetical protein
VIYWTDNMDDGDVASAGDVNGDGFDDLLIGNPGDNFNGRVEIYRGGPAIGLPFVALLGDRGFGRCVSGAGDLNGDGYADIIVGEPLYSLEGALYIGRVSIFFGGRQMNTAVDVVITGREEWGQLGRSVSAAGDVNGDGYDDVVIGSARGDGEALILFGGEQMDNKPDVTLTDGPDSSLANGFGRSVSAAGDVNGDGYDDILVGTFAGQEEVGYAYIYFGGESMSLRPAIVLSNSIPGDLFGYSVAHAGDVNGDGFPDAIIGAPVRQGASSKPGNAYLYLASSPPAKPRLTAVKDVPGDQGGRVLVNFIGSSFDAIGQKGTVNAYVIDMSEPPVLGKFNWIQIGTVLPLQRTHYSFLAPTLRNSSDGTSGAHFFRVTAQLAGGGGLLTSNIASGASIDNLSPAPPTGLQVVQESFGNRLRWKPNAERDLRSYAVFRSDTHPSPAPALLGTTTDTTFADTTAGSFYYYVSAVDIHDNASPFAVDSTMLVSAGLEPVPHSFALHQNYPNPFNPVTKIRFTIVDRRLTIVSVYDLLGREVATLVNEVKEPGTYEVAFDASGLASGVYLYRLQSGDFTQIRRMTVLK